MTCSAPPHPATAGSPPWSREQRIFFWLTFAAGIAWSALVLLCSDGWSLDDELAHFVRSRSVWENPLLIFDAWTRIGRNLFHLLPAWFGLTATRIWTLGFAAVAVWVTTELAACFGARRTWLVPVAMCFQPWFVELSWGVLTQTPFMLCLVTGIWLLTLDRAVLSALFFGMLPLVRHEGVALVALWGMLVALNEIRLRRFACGRLLVAAATAVSPLVAYNVAAWIFLRELPSQVLFSPTPTEIYGRGPLWHFLVISLVPAGPFTLALGLAGLPLIFRAWGTTWPLIFYPAYLALHALIFWKGLFASGGYYHFLMPSAPGLAVLAIFGADALLDSRPRWASATACGLLAGTVLQGLLLVHLWWREMSPTVTLQREPLARAIQAALEWQATHRPAAPVVVCRHVYAALSRGWIETVAQRKLESVPAADLPSGAVVIWESKYSDLNGMRLADLTRSGWHECASFGNGAAKVLEKLR